MDEPELREALDLLAIGRLQARYSDVVSRQAWPELADLFAPACVVHLDLRGRTIELSGAAEVGRFISQSVARFEHFEMAVLNAVADLRSDGSGATGRVWIWELRQDRDDHRWSNAYGLYQDRYERVDGSWVFSDRRYSSLARTEPSDQRAAVFALPPIEP